jgi:addiction module RelB/DinJ family antitoxin
MKTIINVKADKEVKEQAVATAREMGLPLSTVVNAFLRKFIADKSVVFTAPFKPSKKLEKILRQTDKDIEAGRNLSPIFRTVDGLMADLQS